MDKNNNYVKTAGNAGGVSQNPKTQSYGQSSNRESVTDCIADKIDSTATKMADKVHETVSKHKSGANEGAQHGDAKRNDGGCHCSSETGSKSGATPEQANNKTGKSSY